MVEHMERLSAVVKRERGGGLISRAPKASGFINRTRFIWSLANYWCSRRFASIFSFGFLKVDLTGIGLIWLDILNASGGLMSE